MKPNDLIVDGKVDVSAHFSPSTGKMYLPSYPFGIKFLVEWNNEKETGSDSRRTLHEAIVSAECWVEGENSKPENKRYAIVFRRKDGKVMAVKG